MTALILFGMFVASVVGLQITDYSDGQCIVSAQQAQKPNTLELCYWHNQKACCVPQHDKEAGDNYYATVDLGLSCSISKHQYKVTYQYLREWNCIGCDPDEPRYRYKLQKGDKNLAGGQIDPDPNADENAVGWRVCRSFITNGVWGKDGSMYDDCAVMQENPCDGGPALDGNINGKQIYWDPSQNNNTGKVMYSQVAVVQGWDTFMCGDNLIIPSAQYKSAPDPGLAFLQAMRPLGFSDISSPTKFEFKVVDDSKADFSYDATPCFRGSVGSAIGTALQWTVVILFTTIMLL